MEMDIHVPVNAWENTGSEEDPSSSMLSTMHINGIAHHLEAVAVVQKELQETVDSSDTEKLNGMWAISTPDHPFQTVEIGGRDYVLNVTPHSA